VRVAAVGQFAPDFPQVAKGDYDWKIERAEQGMSR